MLCCVLGWVVVCYVGLGCDVLCCVGLGWVGLCWVVLGCVVLGFENHLNIVESAVN